MQFYIHQVAETDIAEPTIVSLSHDTTQDLEGLNPIQLLIHTVLRDDRQKSKLLLLSEADAQFALDEMWTVSGGIHGFGY